MNRVEFTDFPNHKLFKDTVHGYISIPVAYCKRLIDTPEFQRLRRVEQTSMRTLYPCARHDRFSHSLGTYHLGALALKNIERNTKLSDTISNDEWDKLCKTFHIACLLHDIGHAPFSHTFEKYFDIKKGLNDLLTKKATSLGRSDFKHDYKEKGEGAKPHEKLSAYILLRSFFDDIKDLGADPILAACMIIGCQFSDKNELSNYQSVANCLVTLLNGDCIDVDRLDYTSRDLWASGVETSTIDLPRLLSSLCMREYNSTLKIAFLKNAISVIESVLDVRNFLYVWIFSHHKVQYDQYLLDEAIKSLAISLYDKKMTNSMSKDSDNQTEILNEALSELFSVNSFFDPVEVGNYRLKLVTDDDLVFLMKQEIEADTERCNSYNMHSWLYRRHELKPLWKSYPEFRTTFPELTIKKQLNKLYQDANSIVENFFKNDNCNFIVIKVSTSLEEISQKEIIIDMGNETIKGFDKLKLPRKYSDEFPNFFYIYGDEYIFRNKEKLIKELVRLAKK